MGDPQKSDVTPSLRFRQRDHELAALRSTLLDFGLALHLFDVFVGDPAYRYPTLQAYLEEASVEEILGAIQHEWHPAVHPAQEEADPRGDRARDLAASLQVFARAFDLFACDCPSRPACPHGSADKLDPPDLVQLVDTLWHSLSGCLHHQLTTSDGELLMIERQQSVNVDAVARLSERFRPCEATLTRFTVIRGTVLYREALHLAGHTLDVWMPRLQEDPVIETALARARAHAELVEESARDTFIEAANDAFTALMVHRIAHPLVSESLYEPFESVYPLDALFPG